MLFNQTEKYRENTKEFLIVYCPKKAFYSSYFLIYTVDSL